MSKGKQQMRKFSTFKEAAQKIVIKKPWGVEVKDYKAGDPIPAGVQFKIFNATDTAKIDAYADSLDESADYQKKRFKEPYYMYNESKKVVENKMVGIISLPVGSKFIDDSFGGKRTLEVVKHGNDDVVHVKEVGTGRKFAYDASTPGGNKKVEKIEEGCIKESFIIMDTINGKPTYFHYGKFTGYDWGFEKDKATKFSTKEKAEQMIEKMRQEGALVKDMKVIEESKIEESVIRAEYKYGKDTKYVADKDGRELTPWKDKAYQFGSKEEAEKVKNKMTAPSWTLFVEGRIAKGYENLDAEERAKHLLSHPSSKYMNDLKSENITERAIRKAVKEMLGKPDKRDPQFIIDVNEGCGKVEESFLIVGKLPYDDLKQAYISYSDKGLDIHTPEYKKHATRFSSRQEAQKVLDLMKKEGWKTEKFEIVQEEGEAPAIANTTAEVANPDLPLKLKEDLESDKAEALADYKKAKAEYLANKSDENWKKFSNAKSKCMQLGCRI